MGKPVNVEREHVFMTADEERYFKVIQEITRERNLLILEKIALQQTINMLEDELHGMAEDLGYRKIEL